jgi:transcriptional regulator with XRE-family HTH domain
MTQNILFIYCRSIRHYSQKEVAAHLGMTTLMYREIESGEVLLTYDQARKMAQLYETEAKYFFEAAQQLDLLLSGRIIIKTLKADNDRLRADLHQLKEANKPRD